MEKYIVDSIEKDILTEIFQQNELLVDVRNWIFNETGSAYS